MIVFYDGSNVNAGLHAEVGAVCWPLSRAAATLRFDDRTYTFHLPDQLGTYYCVALPPDTEGELIEVLQAVLSSATAYHDHAQAAGAEAGAEQPPVPPPQPAHPPQQLPRGAAAPGAEQQQQRAQPQPHPTAEAVAAGLTRGGRLAAAGIAAAAAWAGAALQRGAEAAVARGGPPGSPRHVSAQTQARLDRVKSATAKAAEVSGRAVACALSMTGAAAGALAGRIASTDLGRRMGEGRSMHDMRHVGEAGLDALEAVYDSLADAARVVLAHTHVAATRVVDHRYGPGAAQATSSGMAAAQNAAEAGIHLAKLRPSALAKRVVKGAAVGVALGRQHQPGHGGAGAGAAAGGSAAAAVATATVSGAGAGGGAAAAAAATAVATAAATAAAAGAGAPGRGPASCAQPAGQQPPQPLLPRAHGSGGAPAVAAPANAGGGGGGGGGFAAHGVSVEVVEGVAVAGPVAAHPVGHGGAYAVYPGLGWGGAAAAAGPGPGGEAVPYPAVSSQQYEARYYPAVPRA